MIGAFAADGGRSDDSFSDEQLSIRFAAGSGAVREGTLAVVVGAIDDRVELARTVGRAPTEPQEQLVLAAFRRWGDDMPAHLRGAFALLVWDGRRRQGLIAVDQLGARTVVYARSAAAFVFAADVRDLLPLLPATPSPDERAVVGWLASGVHAVDETLFSGMKRLPGGHLLRLGGFQPELERYWQPRRQRPDSPSKEDAVAEVRAVLGRAVTRACRRRAPNGILLSGGLDSTSVAATARSHGEPLVAYSAGFPEHAATDESALIAEGARLLELPRRGIAFRRGSALAAGLRYVESWGMPPASPNLFFHEPLLRLAREDGIATMLDGQGGDELFGSVPYFLSDLLRSGRWRAANRLAHMLLGPTNATVPSARRHAFREIALKGALPAWVHRAVRRHRPDHHGPVWLTQRGLALYDDDGSSRWGWKDLPGPRWQAFLTDLLTTGRERTRVHESLRHMFGDAGLTGAHPLLEDAELIETALTLPPELAFHEHLDRPLLRAALAGVLPDPIRLRREKSFFNDVLADALHVQDDRALQRLLDDRAEVRRYVRPDLIDRLRALEPSRRGRRDTLLLWRLAATECWLRQLADPGFARTALETWNLREPRFDLTPVGVD